MNLRITQLVGIQIKIQIKLRYFKILVFYSTYFQNENYNLNDIVINSSMFTGGISDYKFSK